jgi:hypothetical protein
MTVYRCYFVGEDDKIKGAEVIECSTDAAALQEAERRLAASKHPMIEVWDKARRVGTVGHPKAHAGMTAPGQAAGSLRDVGVAPQPVSSCQRHPGMLSQVKIGPEEASSREEGSMRYIAEVAIDAGNLARELSHMRMWLDHMKFQAISFRQIPGENIYRIDFEGEQEARAFARAFAGRVRNRTAA